MSIELCLIRGSQWANLASTVKRPQFNGPLSKNVIFYRQPSKMQININREKVSGISNLASSDDLQGLLAPEEPPNLDFGQSLIFLCKVTARET